MLVDDVLVPARYLVNGVTVAQEAVEDITYFHVELAAHDVLLAAGLRCESYLETGLRAALSCNPGPGNAVVPARDGGLTGIGGALLIHA